MAHKNDKVYGRSFVVVSGDAQLINTLERMLLFAGANVQASTSGQVGLSLVRDIRPDMLVFDTTTSDISATEFVSSLQLNELSKNIPVVIITTSAEMSELQKLFSNGVQDYLKREEFDVMQLILRIEALIRNRPITGNNKIFDFTESEKNILNSIAAKQVRLLIIEDDSLLRNLLSIRLTRNKILFDFCHSGTEALSSVLSFKPSVIVLDLMLPGKSGMEVLAELRNKSETSTIPIIIFSNRDDDADRLKAKQLGVDNFLVKATTDIGDLINLVVECSREST